MKPDLKSMSRKELEKLKANIDKALDKLAAKDKKAAFAAAQKAAAAHGFSLAEITGGNVETAKRKTKSAPKKASPPKYRNPADPEQTWTGKGRQPEWFKAAIGKGTSPDKMEI